MICSHTSSDLPRSFFRDFGHERGEGEGTDALGQKSGEKLKDFEGNVGSHCRRRQRRQGAGVDDDVRVR